MFTGDGANRVQSDSIVIPAGYLMKYIHFPIIDDENYQGPVVITLSISSTDPALPSFNTSSTAMTTLLDPEGECMLIV